MKWKKDSTEHRTIWPYPVAENVVKLEVNAQLKDNGTALEDFVEKNWLPGAAGSSIDRKATWDIFGLGASWNDVAVECAISVDDPDALKKYIFPPGKDVPLSFALLLRCNDTRWRKAVTCAFDGGKGNVKFSLSRPEIAGVVEIYPLVLLAAATGFPTAGWARRKVAKVATGFPVYFRADEPLDRPGGGIDVKWEEFPNELAAALYRLDIADDKKVCIYLNSRYPTLQPIMDNKSKVKTQKTLLRDALFALIAGNVWLLLADAAAHSTPEEGDELPELYDSILKVLSRRLKIDREDILSAFNTDSDALQRAKLHASIQDFLAVAEKSESLILTGPEKTAQGGE